MSSRQVSKLLDAIPEGSLKKVIAYMKYCQSEDVKVDVLHKAVEHERADIIKFLLENVITINNVETSYTQAEKDRAYHKCRSVETSEVFLRCGANVDTFYSYEDGRTPLQHATETSNVELMKLLISYGANPNFCNEFTRTPLETAISLNNETTVRLLLDSGASCNVNSQRQSPLNIAALVGNARIVKWLLEKEPKIDFQTNKLAIFHAVTKIPLGRLADRIKIVEMLIEKGFDWKWMRPIVRAILLNCLPLVKIFLRAGVDMGCEYGTLLHCAALFGSGFGVEGIVDELLKYGANLNDHNAINQTALAVASNAPIALVLLTKMITRNIQISDYDFERLRESFQRDFKSELNLLKQKMIGTSSVSFYNFCFTNVNFMAKVLRNHHIKQVLASRTYTKTFPAFAPLIHHNFEKGTDQNVLIDRGEEKFVNLFPEGHRLPPLVVRAILLYLNTEELEIFLKN